MSKPGIDAISFYVPQLYVSIEDLAKSRNIAFEKLNKGLGLQKMAIPDLGEDAATFAANALLKLFNDFNIDPKHIGRIYLGTESAVDGSKPTATYAIDIVEKALERKFGERCFKNCDVLDMTFACVGAVDALHNSIDWVANGTNRQAIVIASDVSKYDLNSTGEYTQGAGAVAMLITENPSILEVDSIWGVATKSEGDFFKPRRAYNKTELLRSFFEEMDIDASEETLHKFISNTNSSFWANPNETVEVFKEEPIFDGQFSNMCYSERVTEALEHFKGMTTIDFEKDWNHLIFHLPYAYHGRRIIFNNWLAWIKQNGSIKDLEKEIGPLDDSEVKDWNKRAYKSNLYTAFVSKKIASGELASSEIGNMYTASIFMSFLSLLSNAFNKNLNISGDRIGFIGYGSGSKSKIFQGIIKTTWEERLKAVNLFETLDKRESIDISTYEKIHSNKLDKSIVNTNKITLSHIEEDETNLGLRRYVLK